MITLILPDEKVALKLVDEGARIVLLAITGNESKDILYVDKEDHKVYRSECVGSQFGFEVRHNGKVIIE